MRSRRAPPGDAKRGLGYIRVSSSEQRLSPDAQRAAIEAYAKREGIELLGFYTDKVGGAEPIEKRVQLLDAVAAACTQRCGVILIVRRDRLARDVITSAILDRLCETHGTRIVSLAGEGTERDEASDRLFRTILDAVAQFERAMISARTRAALATKRARGEATSGIAPYGFRIGPNGKTLVRDAREWKLVQTILRMRREGKTQLEVEQRLIARGMMGRGGAPLRQTQLSRIERRYRKRDDNKVAA